MASSPESLMVCSYAGLKQRTRRPTALRSTGDVVAVSVLQKWATANAAVYGPIAVQPGKGLVATTSIPAGEVLARVPQALCVSAQDAINHPLVGPLVVGKDEILAITLWAMAEGCVADGFWACYVETFQEVNTPILWAEEARSALLQGSSALVAAREKERAALREWEALRPQFAAQPDKFPADVFTEAVFLRVLCCVLARSVYLPSAGCYALVPVADAARRRCQAPDGAPLAVLDYDNDTQSVLVVAGRNYAPGEEVVLADALQRNSADLLVACGYIDEEGDADYVEIEASLVPVDPLFQAKRARLEAAGLAPKGQTFPLFRDRIPAQLLAYLRLARATTPEDLAKASLDRDETVSPLNEYEVLTLLLTDLRERLLRYPGTGAEDQRIASEPPEGLQQKAVVAAKLRLRERVLLEQTLQALRTRRQAFSGVPTKGGKLVDPNADLNEVFDVMFNPLGKIVDTIQYTLGWDKATPKK